MQVYLFRHAHAVEADNDAARPLSARGREQVNTLAAFLARSGAFQPAEFWHSPLVRARETATLLAHGTGSKAPLRVVPGLEPVDDPRTIERRLRDAPRPVALVGHEPHLSALATLLLEPDANESIVVVKKCAALAFERAEGRWMLCWHISPELLA
jgi:phosphohistidine phosphatase